jgi:hypothetical protein
MPARATTPTAAAPGVRGRRREARRGFGWLWMGVAVLAAGLASYLFFTHALKPSGSVVVPGGRSRAEAVAVPAGGGQAVSALAPTGKSSTDSVKSAAGGLATVRSDVSSAAGGKKPPADSATAVPPPPVAAATPEVMREPGVPAGVCLAVPAAFPADGVAVSVRESDGLARRGGHVTSGVPLPLGALKDPAALALVGPSGGAVPCDFSVLSRWPDGSAKWVLLDFQSDCPAGGSVDYRMVAGRAPAAHAQPVEVQESDGAVELRSAGLSFRASGKCAGLIESVRLGDRVLVEPARPVQVVLVAADGGTYTASKPEKLVVEHRGSTRTTVLASGKLLGPKNAGLLGGKVGYDLRLTAFAGKPFIQVAFTLKNGGFYGYEGEKKPREWLHFKSLRIDMPLAGAAASAVKMAGGEHRLEAGQPVSLVQWYKYPMADCRGFVYKDVFTSEVTREEAAGMADAVKGWYYCSGAAGRQSGHEGLAAGFAELAAAPGLAVGCAVRRFSENFPRGFSATPDCLSVLLWPEGGFWPRTGKACEGSTYQFEGGRHKTADMLFWFGDGQAGGETVGRELDAPLTARAAAAWYGSGTGAVWPLSPAGITPAAPEAVEAVERYERLQLAKVDAAAGDPAGPITPRGPDLWGRVSIPGLWARHPDVFQGWMNYGDLVWGFGYTSLHYDWPYAMMLHHLRTGDGRFMSVGDDMSRHRYDIDQYHVGGTGRWLAFFQRYEKGEHGNQFRAIQPYTELERKACPSHAWNRGPLLHWALTGDRRSLETAVEVGQAYHNFIYSQNKLAEKDSLHWNEFRTAGWAMESWLALYEYTGEGKYLKWAEEVFGKILLSMEKSNGSRGHIIAQGRQGAQFLSYIIEPVCRLHALTGNRDVAGFLWRVLEWQRRTGVAGGTTSGGKYIPTGFIEHWDAGEGLAAVMGYNVAMADGYAYLHRLYGRPEDLQFARRAFRDFVLYYGSRGPTAPEFRTPLGFHYLGDPLSGAEKLHILSTRFGQIYLGAETGTDLRSTALRKQ